MRSGSQLVLLLERFRQYILAGGNTLLEVGFEIMWLTLLPVHPKLAAPWPAAVPAAVSSLAATLSLPLWTLTM